VNLNDDRLLYELESQEGAVPYEKQPSPWTFTRPEEKEWTGEDPYKPVCDVIHQLMLRKSGYYGNPDDGPLCNAMGVAQDGIEPWRYQLARIGEKCRRLRGAAQNNPDIVRETLQDIAGHAIVALACIAEQNK
jgi:hypothetical protein